MDAEIKAQKPSLNDLSPQIFFCTIFCLGSIIALLGNILLAFILGFVALIFGMLIFVRTSQPTERTVLSSGVLKVYKGKKLLWSADAHDIASIDIDTYSEYNRMRGQTMIVFYLKSGDSYSIHYTNYSNTDLFKIKSLIVK